jgi:hypothetical protein
MCKSKIKERGLLSDGLRVNSMTRAAKKKAVSGKKKQPGVKKAATVDLREVRQKVKNIIGQVAPKLAKKVADDALIKVQAQSMKILFEMIGLFPDSSDEQPVAADEQSFAKTLLDSLGLNKLPPETEEEAEQQRELGESARALLSAPGNPVE